MMADLRAWVQGGRRSPCGASIVPGGPFCDPRRVTGLDTGASEGGSSAAQDDATVVEKSGLSAGDVAVQIGLDPRAMGRFQILRRLGQGGMGVVFSAYDEELDRRVAIKLLRGDRLRDPEALQLFRSEAQAMARLSHANVVQIYEVGEHEGQLYIAMEFVQGRTLRRWLQEPHAWRERLAVLCQAGRGLEAAHMAGLVHRDFKPKYRRPSQTAPQPTDRPHSRELGRFERVSLLRLAPRYPALPQILAKLWQRAASWLTPYRGSTSKRQLDPGSASVRHTCLRPPRPTVSLAVPFEKYRLDMARRYRRERRR